MRSRSHYFCFFWLVGGRDISARFIILCGINCCSFGLNVLLYGYLALKEVFWYELTRTLRGLTVGVRRLYLPSGVINQVYAKKKRTVNS